jgi:hypothetical protein
VRPDALRPGRRAGGRGRGLAGAVLVLSLATGCGAIPTDGPVRTAKDVRSGEQEQDPYVRVFAKPPAGGETPVQIVGGFLEATGSVEPGYPMARSYLGPSVRDSWDPGAGMTVYDHAGARLAETGGGTLELTAPAIGSVDHQGAFTPARAGENIRAVFRLAKVEQEWRIVGPPAGIYISQQDFVREYRRVQVFFPDPSGQVLVPDPVFLPVRSGLVTALVKRLLQGPTTWLAPAVQSAIPAGTELESPEVPIESGTADIRLSDRGAPRDPTRSERMIAQLTYTLTEAPGVTSVRVSAGGRPLEVLSHREPYTRRQWRSFTPIDAGQPQDGYYIADGRVHTPIVRGAKPLFGGFGDGALSVSEVAASPDAAQLSVVANGGTEVWMGRASAQGREVRRMRGRDLHSPSYDQFGNLWVVEGRSTAPALWLLRPSGGQPVRIEAPGLRSHVVDRLRIADDGTRVAIVGRRDGRAELLLGRVHRLDGGLEVGALRAVEERLINPSDVAWVSSDRLVVVAEEARAQRQPYFVTVDGAEVQPGLPLAGIVSISAAPDRPLVAGTGSGEMWELRPGEPWVQVEKGVRPVYPG